MRKISFKIGTLFFLAASNSQASPTSSSDAPAFRPEKWNSSEAVQRNNNCYSYAANDIDTTEFGAYPGYRTRGINFRKHYPSYNFFLREIITGAKSDGMIFTGRKALSKPGYYKVAFMAHPDFKQNGYHAWHWLRQDRNGQWSHKDGSGEAVNIDYASRPIYNPETANLGQYKIVGYFLVPKGGIDVGSPKEPITHPSSKPAFSIH